MKVEFIELVDSILSYFNSKRSLLHQKHGPEDHLTIKVVLKECFNGDIKIIHKDAFDYCNHESYITGTLITESGDVEQCYQLSGKGIKLLQEHDSFKNFWKNKTQKEQLEFLNKKRQVIWFYPLLIAGFIAGLLSIISELGIITLPNLSKSKQQSKSTLPSTEEMQSTDSINVISKSK